MQVDTQKPLLQQRILGNRSKGPSQVQKWRLRAVTVHLWLSTLDWICKVGKGDSWPEWNEGCRPLEGARTILTNGSSTIMEIGRLLPLSLSTFKIMKYSKHKYKIKIQLFAQSVGICCSGSDQCYILSVIYMRQGHQVTHTWVYTRLLKITLLSYV